VSASELVDVGDLADVCGVAGGVHAFGDLAERGQEVRRQGIGDLADGYNHCRDFKGHVGSLAMTI
jgi:hypothetical protein